MLIAFKCYDFERNDAIKMADVMIVLKNIPMLDNLRHGEAIGLQNKEIRLSRGEYSQ